MLVFATVACLSLFTVWGLRDAEAATTTTTVEANIVSTIDLVAQNGIVFGDIAASSSNTLVMMVILILLVLLMGALDMAVFTNLDKLSKHLDPSRLAVTEAVFGVLLAALAVQLMLDGMHELGIITMLGAH